MIDEYTNRFDAAVRGHHAASLQQLSPRVQAQLLQRRNAAVRGKPAVRGYRWGYAAAGLAALCALAIGVQFRNPPSAGMAPTNVIMASAANSNSARADSTMLDQDPDFYAWLASTDAMQVAME